MVFPFLLLHFTVDNSLPFRITRSKKSSKCSRASWLKELLLTNSITGISHTRTPRILPHQVLAHLHPSRRARDFSGSDSKATFGSYFTGHKTQVQYLELHFKTSQHGVVQENQSLTNHCLSSFLHLPKSKFRACWAAAVKRKSWGKHQIKWYSFVRLKQFLVRPIKCCQATLEPLITAALNYHDDHFQKSLHHLQFSVAPTQMVGSTAEHQAVIT